jgi:hypothetical protein
MLSFIVPARNLRDVTAECLVSLNTAVHGLGLQDSTEWILLDDNSAPADGVTDLFRSFKAASSAPCHVARFRAWQHYTGVFAYGLSVARGDNVFFISNDMYVTPAWLRTVLAVAAIDRRIGIVRGTSEICDSFPEHEVKPPFQERRADDLVEFAEYYARVRGLEHADDKFLSGDAVLVRRPVIDAVGVMDRQFFGYFGDPDYGLRVRRAGFRLVCAKGAWLKHYGQGHIKDQHLRTRESMDSLHAKRMSLVQAGWDKFRAKWDPALPPAFVNTLPVDWDRLVRDGPRSGSDRVPPIVPDASLVELL